MTTWTLEERDHELALSAGMAAGVAAGTYISFWNALSTGVVYYSAVLAGRVLVRRFKRREEG